MQYFTSQIGDSLIEIKNQNNNNNINNNNNNNNNVRSGAVVYNTILIVIRNRAERIITTLSMIYCIGPARSRGIYKITTQKRKRNNRYRIYKDAGANIFCAKSRLTNNVVATGSS